MSKESDHECKFFAQYLNMALQHRFVRSFAPPTNETAMFAEAIYDVARAYQWNWLKLARLVERLQVIMLDVDFKADFKPHALFDKSINHIALLCYEKISP